MEGACGVNILFLSTWFPYPPDNGSKIRVYHLVRALAQAHAVLLVSFAFDTARPEQPGDLRSLCADIRAVPVDPFVVNRAGALRTFLSPRPMASRPIPAMSQLVTDVLRSHTFDAVVASTGMMADYALLGTHGAARILEEHNSMVRWAREWYVEAQEQLYRARRWLGWQKERWYEARCYPRFDLVTMVSKADRLATLEAAGAHRVRVEVVPSGVDCAHNRPGLTDAQPGSLIYNGSLTYGANYDAMHWFLADIYPRIRAEQPDASMTITGSTKGVDLAGLSLDDSVRLSGFVEDVRIPVAQGTVCVIPIRHGGGTRLKILEAMALGTPVVATSKGAEGLEVTSGHDILIADEPAEFADRVVHLLRDADLRERLARNARRLVEIRYDWQRIGPNFVHLVEETVAKRGTTDKRL
jgi:glycosyltransferase involved in cell wall biosynthesis